jgi:AcrR family transcriptional regulator
MSRTRDGLLDGAAAAIRRDGLRRLTMSGICTRSGVAKATLYNHFRTKPDVLAALVRREVDRVADTALAAAAVGTLADALDAAAAYISEIPAGRVVAQGEPGALVPMLTPGEGPGWAHARERAASVLALEPSHPLVDLTLVWLGSVLLAPPAATARRATAVLLAESAATAHLAQAPPTSTDIDGPVSAVSTVSTDSTDSADSTDSGAREPVTAGTSGTSS